MINGDILEGTQRLHLTLRRLCLANIDIEGYKLGQNRFPVIIVREDPRPALLRSACPVELPGKPEKAGEYFSLMNSDVYIVWKGGENG